MGNPGHETRRSGGVLYTMVAKTRAPGECLSSFLGDTDEPHWGGGRVQVLPRAHDQCGNQKPAPQGETRQARRPLSQTDWPYVSVCGPRSALEVVACHELPLGLLQSGETRHASPPGHQSQMLEGCPLDCHDRNWGTRHKNENKNGTPDVCVPASLLERVARWSMGRGRGGDGAPP